MNTKENILNEVIESNLKKNIFDLKKIWNEIEKKIIILTLIKEEGDTIRTSTILGLSYSTLHAKISRLRIQHFVNN